MVVTPVFANYSSIMITSNRRCVSESKIQLHANTEKFLWLISDTN